MDEKTDKTLREAAIGLKNKVVHAGDCFAAACGQCYLNELCIALSKEGEEKRP